MHYKLQGDFLSEKSRQLWDPQIQIMSTHMFHLDTVLNQQAPM